LFCVDPKSEILFLCLNLFSSPPAFFSVHALGSISSVRRALGVLDLASSLDLGVGFIFRSRHNQIFVARFLLQFLLGPVQEFSGPVKS
jgi:hypothetical protein